MNIQTQNVGIGRLSKLGAFCPLPPEGPLGGSEQAAGREKEGKESKRISKKTLGERERGVITSTR